jgi:hypothetical protein
MRIVVPGSSVLLETAVGFKKGTFQNRCLYPTCILIITAITKYRHALLPASGTGRVRERVYSPPLATDTSKSGDSGDTGDALAIGGSL